LYQYVEGNPVNRVDPTGLLPIRNETGNILPYKPENQSKIIAFCNPGETCDVDGFYPPPVGLPPQKIRDTCIGTPTLDSNCKLHGLCLPLITQKELDPDFFKSRSDWPNPYQKTNGWPDKLIP